MSRGRRSASRPRMAGTVERARTLEKADFEALAAKGALRELDDFSRATLDTFDWLQRQGSTFNDLLDLFVRTKNPIYVLALLTMQVHRSGRPTDQEDATSVARPCDSGNERFRAMLALSKLATVRKRTRSERQAHEFVAATMNLASPGAEDPIDAGRQKLRRWERRYGAELSDFDVAQAVRDQFFYHIGVIQLRLDCLALRLLIAKTGRPPPEAARDSRLIQALLPEAIERYRIMHQPWE